MNQSNTIFLAHANEDKQEVRRVRNLLEDHGLNTWFDENDLEPGERWRDTIPEAIKGAKAFLIFLSKKSIEKTGYVQNELRIALRFFEEKPLNTIFIPVLLEDIPIPAVSMGTINLSDYNAVRLFESDGTRRLIQALQKQLNIITKIKLEEKPIFDTMREAISRGEIDEALTSLGQYIRKYAPEYSNNLIMITAQHNRFKTSAMLGMVKHGSPEGNRIMYAIIELITIIERSIESK